MGEQQAGREAQDAVLSKAEQRAQFRRRAFAEFLKLASGAYTGEDIRLAIEAAGVSPHSPNAWGAFISYLIREGELEKTGSYIPMRAKGSHGRATRVYLKRTGAAGSQGTL